MKKNIKGIFAELYNNQEKLKDLSSKAEKLLKRKGVDVLAQYITPEDIIFEIITGVLTGKISWDRERVPNLNIFMYHQIRSYVANLHKKEQRQQLIYRSFYECLPCPKRKFFEIKANEEEEPEIQGTSMEEVLKEQYLLDTVDVVKKELEKDVVAYFVFENKLQGYDSWDSAEELKLPQPEVMCAYRRINKIISKIAEKINEEESLKED